MSVKYVAINILCCQLCSAFLKGFLFIVLMADVLPYKAVAGVAVVIVTVHLRKQVNKSSKQEKRTLDDLYIGTCHLTYFQSSTNLL